MTEEISSFVVSKQFDIIADEIMREDSVYLSQIVNEEVALTKGGVGREWLENTGIIESDKQVEVTDT